MHCILHYILLSHFFVCDLKISAKTNAKKIADAIPPAVAPSPPVNIPTNPCVSTAPITPFASDAPKPMIGTFIPAPAKSEIASKTPIACRKTPTSSNVTRILADVMFVVIMRISPSIQINPPIKNTHK